MTHALVTITIGATIYLVAWSRGRSDGFHRGWRNGVASVIRTKAHAELAAAAAAMRRLDAAPRKAA